MGMDPELRRRYLHAMGVQVWRSRTPAGEVGLIAPQDMNPEPDSDLNPDPGLATMEAAPAPGHRGAVADMDWDTLRAEVAACRACGLCETRTQTVFGVGNRQADLMIIGEAPGVDEDRAGEPFVGRAGRLLNLMLASIGLRRDQVYIANILKCHPPGNRDPSPEEALRCEPFLLHQIELVRPSLVLSVGRISAQNLLRTGTSVGRLRGQWFELGPDRTPLAVTYHPAYLLRSPDQKGLVWQDLQRVARKLRELQNAAAGCGGGS
jgi:uracil-DNA glycosylase family 4